MARKRELIKPHPGDKRYIRRNNDGQFTTDQVNVHRSLSEDDRKVAKNKAPEGQGDKGDRQTGKRKK